MEHILTLNREELFKYVGNGCFLTDCLLNESEYQRLLNEALLPDFNQLEDFLITFADEKQNLQEQVRWIMISRQEPNKPAQDDFGPFDTGTL